jgi:iron complex outermembrane recepter protein
MNKTLSRTVFGASLVSALLCSTGAFAQVASPEDKEATAGSGIADIVVTAERRSTSVQKSSVAIEVLSAEDVVKAGITRAQDLSVAMPSVQIGQGGAATQIYIRGVGDFGSTAATNPAVAFNVDGVYVARSQAVEGNFFDLERIEVLKGPQGTLYGRNATGGAINVITNKPKLGVFGGEGALEFGNYSKKLGELAVNVPLGETAALRVAGQVVDREPYSNYNYNDEVRQSVRGQVLFEPSDRLSVLLGADYTHVGGGGAGYVGLNIPGIDPWTSTADPRVVAVYEQAAAAAGRCAPAGLTPSTYQGACPAGFTSLLHPATGLRGKTDNEFYSFSGQLDYDFGPVTLTVIPAYRSASMDYEVQPGMGTYDNSIDGNPETSKAKSLEARLSHESDKLKFTLGAYYFNEEQLGTFQISFGVLNELAQSQDIETTSYAGFGQATYSVTDAFRVIGGLRYTSDKRDVSYGSWNMNGSPTNPDSSFGFLGALGAGCTPEVPTGASVQVGCNAFRVTGSSKTSKVNWKVGAEFDVGPQNMVYATVSTGMKAGGIAIAQSSPGVPQVYKPESLLAYEVGSRNRFLDNKLQVNLEAFYYDYKDHQEVFVGLDGTGSPNQLFVNAGKGRAIGANVDVVFMPTPNDRLRLGVEYNNTKYTDFKYDSNYAGFTGPFLTAAATDCPVTNDTVNLVQTVDCSGRQFVRSPEWTGVASYAHRFDLAGGSALEVEGNMQFVSSRYLGAEYREDSHVGSNEVYNASATYTAPDKNWSASAFIRNISNEAVYTASFRANFAQEFINASINPPRTYGVRLNYKF